jgi:anti-sigma factor RsiW
LHGSNEIEGPASQQLAAQQNFATSTAGFVHQAAIAHVVYSPDIRRPVEIGADQEDQLVAWLSKRLGSKIRPPKLGKIGFELIGGRLLPGESGPVAQFMYNDATGQRMTLYVSNEQVQNKDTAFRFTQDGPVNVFYWIDGKFGYAISSGIDKGRLATVANSVYEQMEASK